MFKDRNYKAGASSIVQGRYYSQGAGTIVQRQQTQCRGRHYSGQILQSRGRHYNSEAENLGEGYILLFHIRQFLAISK